MYTWAAHEVPAMIRHNFPNTSGNRDAWMIGGFSAGAYCAVWTALRTPETSARPPPCPATTPKSKAR